MHSMHKLQCIVKNDNTQVSFVVVVMLFVAVVCCCLTSFHTSPMLLGVAFGSPLQRWLKIVFVTLQCDSINP